MRSAHRIAFAAAVAAVCMLVVARGAGAGAEEDGTVTTVLYPGWNMAGCLGGDAPASAIFDEVPALRAVAAWDASGQRYVWADAGSPGSALRTLTTGMGLWLRVGGDIPVTWEQRPDAAPVTLQLRAGRNLVAWTGSDGAALRDATARLAPAVLGVSRWNAAAARTEAFRVTAPTRALPLRALGRGDALWVDMQHGARWYQSGTALTAFEYPDDFQHHQRAAVERGLADVLGFFAERYAIEPPPFTVVVEHDIDVYAGVIGQRLFLSVSAATHRAVGSTHEALARTLAHEYFHIVQHDLAGASSDASPAWMIEGAAVFAENAYTRARYGWRDDRIRIEQYRLASGVPGELAGLEDGRAFHDVGAPAYGLSGLAVEWLVGHASSAATGSGFAPLDAGWSVSPETDNHVRYHRLLASADGWDEAFLAAFSITPAAFYRAFERYRADLMPRLQHAGAPRPAVIAVGEVASGIVKRIESDVEAADAFLGARFNAGASAYTVLVVPGPSRSRHGEGLWASASADARSAAGRPLSSPGCLRHGAGWVMYRADCATLPDPGDWLRTRIEALLAERAAPLGAPTWLDTGGAMYVAAARRAAQSNSALDATLAAFSVVATQTPVDMSSLAAPEAWEKSYGRAVREAWAVLAVDWLLQRASEPALFEYWLLLSGGLDAPATTTTAAEAFERAFGLAHGDFYARFAADGEVTGQRLVLAPDTPYLYPAAPGWDALIRDHLTATRSVVLDAEGCPVRAAWVATYGRASGDGGVLASASASALAHTNHRGEFDASAGAPPQAWAVIVGGTRHEGAQLSVRRSLGGAYIIRVFGELYCARQ